jgi:hypothetical protein
MSKGALVLSLLAAGLIVPLRAQGTMTFNMGGGISTPLNAFNSTAPTTLIPVTLGIRLNRTAAT